MESPKLRVRELLHSSLRALRGGNLFLAERAANEAMGVALDYEIHSGIVSALVVQARIARFYGDYEQAHMSAREALRWHRLHVTPARSP